MTQVPARFRSWTRGGPYAQGMRSGRWGSVLRGVVLDEDPVPVVFPEPLADEARALLDRGDRAGAGALVRQRTHLDLRPAVLAVDALR